MIVEFDSNAYSVVTVKKAAYELSAVANIDIKLLKNSIVCDLSIKNGIDADISIDTLASQLKDLVLDYDLRNTISEETKDYRNLILSLAFSKVEKD